MRALLRDDAFPADQPSLSPDVQDIVAAGWTVGPNGALLLAAYWRAGMHVIPAAGLGHGEYEVNDVHVSLEDLRGEPDGFLPRAAARGLWFAHRMLTGAGDLPAADTLLAMVAISVDVDDEDFALQGVTVRFFSRRGDHPDWSEDLESFPHEAIAVLDASDMSEAIPTHGEARGGER